LNVLGVDLVEYPDDDQLVEGVRHSEPQLIVVSADWKPEWDVERKLWELPAPIWSDVEFAWRVADKSAGRPKIVLLGGADAARIADISQGVLMHADRRAARAGTDAPPILDIIRHPEPVELVLWSLSARQLWRMGHQGDTLRTPLLSCGIDDDGLTLELAQALYAHTELFCLYRRTGGTTEKGLERAYVVEGARAIGIGVDTPGMSDVGVVDGIVCDRAFLDDRRERALELCTVAELEGMGQSTPHHLFPALAAFAIARALDVSPELIGGALQAHPGLFDN